MDNVHQRRTTDVYEHALTITAWQQIYDQLHPGKFHGEFTEILLDEIQVFREYTGLALRQSCLVWPNSSRVWFGQTLSGLVFRRRAANRDLSARRGSAAPRLPPDREAPSLN